eukprot:1359956-Amphidinium_carterae.5
MHNKEIWIYFDKTIVEVSANMLSARIGGLAALALLARTLFPYDTLCSMCAQQGFTNNRTNITDNPTDSHITDMHTIYSTKCKPHVSSTDVTFAGSSSEQTSAVYMLSMELYASSFHPLLLLPPRSTPTCLQENLWGGFCITLLTLPITVSVCAHTCHFKHTNCWLSAPLLLSTLALPLAQVHAQLLHVLFAPRTSSGKKSLPQRAFTSCSVRHASCRIGCWAGFSGCTWLGIFKTPSLNFRA